MYDEDEDEIVIYLTMDDALVALDAVSSISAQTNKQGEGLDIIWNALMCSIP